MEELAEDTKYFAIKAGLTSKANMQTIIEDDQAYFHV